MVAGLAFANDALALCHNFTTDTVGNYMGNYTGPTLANGSFVDYTGLNGGTLSVDAAAAVTGNSKALRLIGSGDDYHRADFGMGDGSYPVEVSIIVWAHAGDITVRAFDSGNNVLDTQTAFHGNDANEVYFFEDEIAYVTFTGGNNEDWIDTVCFDD